jgi:hypothetical protein
MWGSFDIFDEYSHGGREIFYVVTGKGLKDKKGGSPEESDIRRYLEAVVAIFESFARTHDKMVKVLNKAIRTSDLVDTKNQLNQFFNDIGLKGNNAGGQTNLKKTLKELDMCINLHNLGLDLKKWKNKNIKDRYDEKFWNNLVDRLMGAETIAAGAYRDAFSGLQKLVNSDPSFEILKDEIKEIKKELIDQKKEFDNLAIDAKTELDKMKK